VAALVEYLTQQGYAEGHLHFGNGTNGHNGKQDSDDSMPDVPAEFYQFQRSPEYLNMQAYLKEVGKAGSPFFTVHDGIAGDTIETDGRELINYSSYNYLDLSGHLNVNSATKAAIDHYGTSVSASRVVSGERPLHRELERELAAWVGAEDAIVYVGGHTTNTSTIGHLFGKDDLILYDALSHNSIRQGCALSNATAIEFPHNDWRSLDRLLSQQRRRYQKVLIAIEGIYSTDGDIAPLPEIVKIKSRHKAFLLVDEAHSIGVLGATGRGIGEYFGIPGRQVDLWMGTLSKSFASCGGYIAGDRALVEYLKYTAPGFVFSVGMSPPNTAAALAALRQLQAEPERVVQLQERAGLFLQLAKQRGFNTGMSQGSPVIPVIVGEAEKAIALSQCLAERGINAQPMIHPSVPLNGARLRFFISCSHTEAQIRFTVETLAEAIAEVEAAV
jgi:8-amino-7-oxononanoate synthase